MSLSKAISCLLASLLTGVICAQNQDGFVNEKVKYIRTSCLDTVVLSTPVELDGTTGYYTCHQFDPGMTLEFGLNGAGNVVIVNGDLIDTEGEFLRDPGSNMLYQPEKDIIGSDGRVFRINKTITADYSTITITGDLVTNDRYTSNRTVVLSARSDRAWEDVKPPQAAKENSERSLSNK